MTKRYLLATILLGAVFCASGTVLGQMLDRTPTRSQTTLDPGLKRIGTISPRSVTEIPGDQNWTLGCETLDRDYLFWETYRDYVAPLGIKRIRLQAGWAKTEREKGTLDFSWLDVIIDDAAKRGLSVWLETDYGNPIYEGGGGADLAAGFPTSDEALAAWDRWVEALATRYQDKVWAWAMWNEPDIGKPKKTPEAIAEFNIRTAEVLKRVIPDAKIGALSLAHNSPEFLDQCLGVIAKRGKTDLFDSVIYHGYAPNPDSSYENVEAMKKVVEKYDPRLKLWQGENGCPSERATRFALANYPWTELTQAKWDLRRMLGDLGHDVLSSVFTICDFDHTGREINHKGLLKINDKRNLAKVKLAYYSVQNVVSVFDATLARDAKRAVSIKAENDVPVTAFLYRDDAAGQDLLVFWDGGAIPSDENKTFKATIAVEAGRFTDPVWGDLVTGAIYEIDPKTVRVENGQTIFTDVPVYDAPTFLVDRARLLSK